MHAGSAPSTLLQAALITTQEGVRGDWTTPGAVPDPGVTFPSPTSLEYLSSSRRMQVVRSAIAPLFRVLPSGPFSHGAALLWFAPVGPIALLQRPSLDMDELKEQIDLVLGYSDLRLDRSAEIYAQKDDLLSFFGSAVRMNFRDREDLVEMLAITQGVCSDIEMQVKHQCWTPRPIDVDSRVLPIIQTPDHSSFPSGHAVEAFAMATVLHRYVTGETPEQGLESFALPFRIAQRIAVNRIVAGVHFATDTVAGAVLGIAIGEAMIRMLWSEGDVPFRRYIGGSTDDVTSDIILKAQEPVTPGDFDANAGLNEETDKYSRVETMMRNAAVEHAKAYAEAIADAPEGA